VCNVSYLQGVIGWLHAAQCMQRTKAGFSGGTTAFPLVAIDRGVVMWSLPSPHVDMEVCSASSPAALHDRVVSSTLELVRLYHLVGTVHC
jgi:hypothetical protein